MIRPNGFEKFVKKNDKKLIKIQKGAKKERFFWVSIYKKYHFCRYFFIF